MERTSFLFSLFMNLSKFHSLEYDLKTQLDHLNESMLLQGLLMFSAYDSQFDHFRLDCVNVTWEMNITFQRNIQTVIGFFPLETSI